jgi:hypothetical protein
MRRTLELNDGFDGFNDIRLSLMVNLMVGLMVDEAKLMRTHPKRSKLNFLI